MGIDRSAALAQWSASANEKYGRRTAVLGKDDRTRRVMRGRLDSVGWQYVTGGGLQYQTIQLFVGVEHSGKTTVALMNAADVHRRCNNCAREYRQIKYGPPGDATDVKADGAAYPIAEGCEWAFPDMPPFLAMRHKATGIPGRIISIRMRTKTKRNVLVCYGQGEGLDGTGHTPKFVDVPLDEPDKSEWEVCKEHGAVFTVPYCDCVFDSELSQDIPYLVDPASGKPETDSEYEERIAQYRLAGNSYEATYVWFLDLEDKLNLEWAEFIGCDLSRLLVAGVSHGEDVVDITDAAIDSGIFFLAIIDSVEYIEPGAQVDQSAADGEDQGRGAKLVNRGFRKWVLGNAKTRRQLGRKTSLIIINQFRQARDGSYTMPKGMSQKFSASSIYKFWSSGTDKEKVEVTGKKGSDKGSSGDAVTSVESTRINFLAMKQGSGSKDTQASFELRMRPLSVQGTEVVGKGRIYDHEYIFKILMTSGDISKADGSLVVCGRTFSTQKEIKLALFFDPEFYRAASDAALAVLMSYQDASVEF